MCPQLPRLSPEYSHKAGLQTVITGMPLQIRPVTRGGYAGPVTMGRIARGPLSWTRPHCGMPSSPVFVPLDQAKGVPACFVSVRAAAKQRRLLAKGGVSAFAPTVVYMGRETGLLQLLAPLLLTGGKIADLVIRGNLVINRLECCRWRSIPRQRAGEPEQKSRTNDSCLRRTAVVGVPAGPDGWRLSHRERRSGGSAVQVSRQKRQTSPGPLRFLRRPLQRPAVLPPRLQDQMEANELDAGDAWNGVGWSGAEGCHKRAETESAQSHRTAPHDPRGPALMWRTKVPSHAHRRTTVSCREPARARAAPSPSPDWPLTCSVASRLRLELGMISTASARALGAGGSRCRSSHGTTMAEPYYNKADYTRLQIASCHQNSSGKVKTQEREKKKLCALSGSKSFYEEQELACNLIRELRLTLSFF
jgi:hypothetical protein